MKCKDFNLGSQIENDLLCFFFFFKFRFSFFTGNNLPLLAFFTFTRLQRVHTHFALEQTFIHYSFWPCVFTEITTPGPLTFRKRPTAEGLPESTMSQKQPGFNHKTTTNQTTIATTLLTARSRNAEKETELWKSESSPPEFAPHRDTDASKLPRFRH